MCIPIKKTAGATRTADQKTFNKLLLGTRGIGESTEKGSVSAVLTRQAASENDSAEVGCGFVG